MREKKKKDWVWSSAKIREDFILVTFPHRKWLDALSAGQLLSPLRFSLLLMPDRPQSLPSEMIQYPVVTAAEGNLHACHWSPPDASFFSWLHLILCLCFYIVWSALSTFFLSPSFFIHHFVDYSINSFSTFSLLAYGSLHMVPPGSHTAYIEPPPPTPHPQLFPIERP